MSYLKNRLLLYKWCLKWFFVRKFSIIRKKSSLLAYWARAQTSAQVNLFRAARNMQNAKTKRSHAAALCSLVSTAHVSLVTHKTGAYSVTVWKKKAAKGVIIIIQGIGHSPLHKWTQIIIHSHNIQLSWPYWRSSFNDVKCCWNDYYLPLKIRSVHNSRAIGELCYLAKYRKMQDDYNEASGYTNLFARK